MHLDHRYSTPSAQRLDVWLLNSVYEKPDYAPDNVYEKPDYAPDKLTEDKFNLISAALAFVRCL